MKGMSRTGKVWTLVAVVALAGAVGEAAVQEPATRVAAEAVDLKWSATGRLLGRLDAGARVERLAVRDGWARARVQGWVEADAVAARGKRLAIEAPEARLRAAPDGEAVAVLRQGVEVDRIAGEGEWYEVVMIGWVPESVLVEPEPAVVAAPPEPVEEVASDPAPADGGAMGRLARAVGLRGVPEGPELAPLPTGAVVRALETRGGWTRVMIEGWVPSAVVEAGAEAGIDPEMVAQAPPGAFDGRGVAWTLEHVAVLRADEHRTDFRPGETFELARVPGAAGRYVYLALPGTLAERFEEMAPFERVRVAGTIRTGKSSLTGNPIVDVGRVLP